MEPLTRDARGILLTGVLAGSPYRARDSVAWNRDQQEGCPRDPYDRALTDPVGELSMRSQEFRVRWAAHDVRYYRSGIQRFRHPLAGS